MADTTTLNYGWTKPGVNDPAGQDLWGGKINADLDGIDATVKAVSNVANAAAPAASVPAPSSSTPAMDGTAAAGSATAYARGDHVHPTDTTRAPLASPTFTGTVTIPSGASIAGYATSAAVAAGYLPLSGGTVNGQITTTAASGAALTIGGWGSNWANYYGGHSIAFGWNGTTIAVYVDNTFQGGMTLTGSDRRIKRNIKPSKSDSLAALKKVELFEFDKFASIPAREKSEGARHFTAGFVAQQLQEVLGEAVMPQGEREGDTLSLDLLPLIAHCVRAIQQLSEKVEALEAGR